MTQHSDARSGWRPFFLLFVVSAVIGFASWDAIGRARHLLELSAGYGVAVDAPDIEARSPTGYAAGRRSLVLPPGAADSAHWVMQTQTALATGAWRLRNVDYDNAPHGREVHWAMPFRWGLSSVARIDHFVSGRPLGISVERAALWIGPLTLGLFLAVYTLLVSRTFSGVGAALGAFAAVAAYPFYLDFRPGAPDHHGVANLCGFFTLLGLAGATFGGARSAARPDAAKAPAGEPRHWLIMSAILGGVGLWISAATQVPVLVGAGLGLLAAGWFGRGDREAIAWVRNPGLLRLWGCIGGATSLVAYLVEYFPSHVGWRLEVNHPLYAFAWIGAGEVLRVTTLLMRDGRSAIGRRDLLGGVIGAVAVVALPVIIWGSAAKTFTVRDPFVWRLHSLYISEFQGLGRHFTGGLNRKWIAVFAPSLVLIPAVWLMVRRATTPAARALLGVVVVPAGLAWCAGWLQVRWLSLAIALSLALIAVVFGVLRSHSRRAGAAWSVFIVVLLGLGAIDATRRARANGEITPQEIQALAERDVAHWLKLRAGDARVVVASGPSPTTNLISLGGLTGLGTLYWENAAGLKKAAEMFAAPPERAGELARAWGVTHLVQFSWSRFESSLAKLHRGLLESAPLPSDSLVAQLETSPIAPAWLRPIPFKLPDHPALEGAQVRIWQVGREQPPARALARAANYYLEMGRAEDAARLLPLLARFDGDLVAMVMRAGIAGRQQDAATFGPAFQRVLALLGDAGQLTLEEHVHLVVVLTVGQRVDLARAQLQTALQRADARALRELTPGTLADLISLRRAFRAEFPTPELQQLAERLLPPAQRE